MKTKKDLIIIGAGLSGLYAAYLLQEDFEITLLEARDRTGGRILTQNGHDLGPSWVWPHQKNIHALINELGLQLFPQYAEGDALYDASQGLQRFHTPPNPPSSRIVGGVEKLIEALSDRLHASTTLLLDEKVIALEETDNDIRVKTQNHTYKTDLVISTLPPRLASLNISYAPALSLEQKKTLESHHSWMGHTAKCVIEFKEAFWRNENLSGFVFSHIGPLGEIHDACTTEKAALFGFLHHQSSAADIEEKVKEQMFRLFGQKAELITKISCADWREEEYSSCSLDHAGLSEHPQYGFNVQHFNNRLFFIGTESSYDDGGYLEGAVISAKSLANTLHGEHLRDFERA